MAHQEFADAVAGGHLALVPTANRHGSDRFASVLASPGRNLERRVRHGCHPSRYLDRLTATQSGGSIIEPPGLVSPLPAHVTNPNNLARLFNSAPFLRVR